MEPSLIVVLKGQKTVFQGGERSEIVRRQDFSLHDREVDFDLVEPTGVDRSVHGLQRRPRACSRASAFWPRCAEQLSMIQKTRRAEW